MGANSKTVKYKFDRENNLNEVVALLDLLHEQHMKRRMLEPCQPTLQWACKDHRNTPRSNRLVLSPLVAIFRAINWMPGQANS